MNWVYSMICMAFSFLLMTQTRKLTFTMIDLLIQRVTADCEVTRLSWVLQKVGNGNEEIVEKFGEYSKEFVDGFAKN